MECSLKNHGIEHSGNQVLKKLGRSSSLQGDRLEDKNRHRKKEDKREREIEDRDNTDAHTVGEGGKRIWMREKEEEKNNKTHQSLECCVLAKPSLEGRRQCCSERRVFT